MSFSDFDVTRRTRKGNFLIQIDDLIDWALIEETIVQHYSPASDVTGRPAYPGLLLYSMSLNAPLAARCVGLAESSCVTEA